MTVRDTVLLLVSVGRFGCFGYGAASRRECSALFESFTSLLFLSASLREYDLFFRTSIEGACSGSLRGSWLLQSQTSAAILFEGAVRYPFEGAVYLSRYRVSLREFDGLLNLVPALLEGLVFNLLFSLRESGLQPLAVSPRESGLLLLCACAGSLREFRLVIVSIGRLNPPPPSVSVSPPPSKFAMSQPEIADRFPSPLQKPESDCLPVLRRNISSLKDAKYIEG
ncbi:hypothetical protein ACMYSQ_004106 [Aspergillus niger]|nr:hypothetical protein AnigIFM63326_003569 [Aspergillus niger]